MANTGNTQQIIDYGASANDGTGDPLRTAFIKTDENFSNIWLAGPVGSNITIVNNTIQNDSTNGNIILKPNGIGVVQSNASVLPNATNLRDLGSANLRWRRIYANTFAVNDLEIDGNLTVGGNLTVVGDTIQIGNIITDTLRVQLANTAATDAAADGAGITVGANDDIATLLYDSANNAWTTNIGVEVGGPITGTSIAVSDATVYGNVDAINGNFTGNVSANNFTGNFFGNIQSPGNIGEVLFTGPDGYITTNNQLYYTPANGDFYSYRIHCGLGGIGPEIFGSPFYLANRAANAIYMGGNANVILIGNTNSYTTFAGNVSVIGNILGDGNISANYYIGDGSQLTGITTYANANAVSYGEAGWAGNILPDTSNVYSLGNATNQWKSLYVSNTTIYINNVPIGLTAGNVLTVDGEPILSNDSNTSITTTGNLTANIITATESADLGSLNFYASSITMADDVWDNILIAPAAESYAFLSLPKDSVANVQDTRLHNDAGNVEIGTNGGINTWLFDSTGNLNYPDGTISTGGQTYAAANSSVQLISNNEYNQVRVDNANVEIYTSPNGVSQYQWTYDNTGNLTAPGNIATTGNVDANYINVTHDILANYIEATANIAAGNVIVTGGLYGLSVDAPGTITGGTLSTAGNVVTGNILTDGYYYANGAPFTPGSNYGDSNVATFLANFGSNAVSTTGNVTANNFIGNISITGNVTGTSSNVDIVSGSYTWSFNNAGNLVLPANTFSVNYANGTAVSLGGGGTPGGANTQIQFNDNNAFGGTSGFTFDKSTNAVATTGTFSATGNITGGNLVTAGLVTATGNITGGNLSVTGNVNGNVAGFAIGYRDIPVVSLAANTTISTSDAGKQYYSTSATPYTWTIANNASQAFQTGATINIVNQGSANVSILRGVGVTLYLAGNSTSSDRTLTSFGVASITKVATDTWFISGVGLV